MDQVVTQVARADVAELLSSSYSSRQVLEIYCGWIVIGSGTLAILFHGCIELNFGSNVTSFAHRSLLIANTFFTVFCWTLSNRSPF